MSKKDQRDSFIFYRSFFEAIKESPTKHRLEIYESICNYVLNGVVPENKGVPKMAWKLIKPQLDANIRRFENGKKGGRPKNQNITKDKPRNNLDLTKAKPNVNDNVNDNNNGNEYSEEFKRFWDKYPRKANKKGAYKSFKKVDGKKTIDAILDGLEKYQFSDETKYIPHASTWLSQERWEDVEDTSIDAKQQLRDTDPMLDINTYNL